MDNSKIRGKVSLVGAPSTRKSTLFNRIIGERRSIVSDEYGIPSYSIIIFHRDNID